MVSQRTPTNEDNVAQRVIIEEMNTGVESLKGA